MSLKTRPSSDGSSQLSDPWSGLWGAVVADSQSLSMLRVELNTNVEKQELHAFAYSTLVRWVCRRTADEEEWEITFGKQLLRVEGRRLARLMDALDEGRLKLIRTSSTVLEDDQPWVKNLTIREMGANPG
jgi:hypothetical protein